MSKLYDPNYLKHLCQKFGLVPSKKYGQNFLINPEPIEKMIEASEIGVGDTIIEVGPGFGVLTFELAKKAKVKAFEIEKILMPYWDEVIGHPEFISGSKGMPKQARQDNIEIVWGNVLKNQKLVVDKNYKLVANLPYQITSNLIRVFLEAENKPEMMVLMVQKEVAERICAKEGEMSVLSVAVQFYAEPEIISQVPKSFFWPEPKVDSAVIKLKVRSGVVQNANFFNIVKAGFANRRKLLIKNLESLFGRDNRSKLDQIFTDLGLNPKARAQELSVEKWKQLVSASYPLIS